MVHPAASPYERAIGDRMSQLHPALRTYFSSIPEGSVGVGEGVFERVGSRWGILRLLARPLQRRGVVIGGLHHEVPFRVENRTVAGRAVARRTLALAAGPWTMTDSVALSRGGCLVDRLGSPPTIAVSFDVEIRDGAVALRSRRVGLRLGRLRLVCPDLIAPRVLLRESFDDDAGRQRVAVTIDMPILGRVYEYEGSFTYRIQEDV